MPFQIPNHEAQIVANNTSGKRPSDFPKAWSTLYNQVQRYDYYLSSSYTMLIMVVQSDSTRAKTLELHIQARVAEELKQLQDRAAKDFQELQAKISAVEESSKKEQPKSSGDSLRELGREAVQNDVQQLRKKLEQRKKLADIDESVESAKNAVVKCLRDNDRRPLDCWKEVEAFKAEVRKLEGTWVEKVVR